MNGNITHLTRTTGDASDNDIDMDDLSYTYDKDGLSNLLVNVEDAVTTGSNEGFKDGNTDPLLDDYEYDANGNMIKDRNKGISNISYNHLNLPTQIEFEGTNDKITYLYNSVGQKLKKTVVYSDSIKIVDYLDGFQTEERGSRIPVGALATQLSNNEQYAGNILQFFPHAEGYVKVTPTYSRPGDMGYAYNYVYNYTDHLGNVRLSYSKDPQTHQLKILEENHYYPFGLKHSVYTGGRLRDFEVDFSNPEEEKVFLTPVTKTEYQYKYNGQEWQDELGLNMYAMDMRQYDPAIGRWVAQDPVIHHSMSPYNAFDNNPVFWADPSGADSGIFPDSMDNSSPMFSVLNDSYNFSDSYETTETTTYSISTSVEDSTPSDCIDLGGESTKQVSVTKTTHHEGGADISSSGWSDLFGLPNYIRNAYKNNYDPRFSPYTPDAISLNIGFSMNFLIVHIDVSASLIFSPGEISLGGSANGGFGYTGFKPSWGPYASVEFHDVYGSQPDVLKGMQGISSSTNTALGPVNINYSQSATMDGTYNTQGGTRNVNIGVGNPGLGASQTFPATVIWRPFK